MKYLFLTDEPEIAAYVHRCGVQRIFVDLEYLGKKERQSGRDTVISKHRGENIPQVRASVPEAELVVRVNPLHAGTMREVAACIDGGADFLMLPMFRSAAEVKQFCRYVGDRVPVLALVETAGGMRELEAILRIEQVREIHVGLNDLHLDLGLRFLFEPLASGIVDRLVENCHQSGKPVGIGGISTVGDGLVPAELVLGEYVRLGAHSTILSRSFHRRATTLQQLQQQVDVAKELARLEALEQELRRRDLQQVAEDQARFKRRVQDIVAVGA